TNPDTSSTSGIHVGNSTLIKKVAKKQDPSIIISALDQCMDALPKDKLKKVKCIGVCGQMHGIKSGCECADFLSSLPKPDSHLSMATGFGCATIFWYMKHSDAGTIQDYVVSMLCNLDKCVMTGQNADACFPVQLLPVVMESGAVAGHTSGIVPADVQRACRVHPSKFSRPPFSCFSCLAMAASLNGANFMATFVRMLDSWMKEFGKSTIFQFLNVLLFASVSQTSPSNLSLGHVTRASLQAAGVRCIIGSGSALSCNTVLQQEVERVFTFPVVSFRYVDSAVGVTKTPKYNT
uniref:Uncharacterized protein n=1 Tax=Cyprinus carpio TaxID=7962 RepID=A0A8C2C487_CYPCA